MPVHEAGRWPNGDPYYVMKLVEGRTLKELIAERTTLRDRLGLLPHVIAIADAVGYAHSEGVIHRDLKPSNVIVGEFGETIVVDWGLARDRKRDVPEPATEQVLDAAGSGASTVSGKVVGTPAYMAPEQARGELVDERADVYAIGAVLYELLAGTPPHADTTPQATLDRVIAGPPRAARDAPSRTCRASSRRSSRRRWRATPTSATRTRARSPRICAGSRPASWSARTRTRRGRCCARSCRSTAASSRSRSRARSRSARSASSRSAASSPSATSRAASAGAPIASQAQAEKRKRELVLLQAETSLRKDPTAALAWLKDYQIADDDRAHVVDVIDEALALGVARHVFRPGDWVLDAAFTPDGETLVAAVRDGEVRAYDVRTGEERKLGTRGVGDRGARDVARRRGSWSPAACSARSSCGRSTARRRACCRRAAGWR